MNYALPCLILIFISLLSCLPVSSQAQDTVFTNYPNTLQRWEKVFIANKKVSENIYHANGTQWMTVRYDSSSVEHWKWYHENGNPFFEAKILDDELQGAYRVWYENGQLAERLFFKDNLENGRAEFYHPNGQLAMTGNFEQGKMTGQWMCYDTAGGLAEGAWVWRFAALPENIRMSGNLVNGAPTGTWNYQTTAADSNQKKRNYTIRF